MAAKKKAIKKTSSNDALEKEIGEKATQFLKIRKKLQKANKVVNELKAEAHELEKQLIPMFEKSKQEGTKVKLGSVNLKIDDAFNAKDWSKINKHIDKTGDHDLYQRRLNQTLLKDYFKDGVKIPGVQHMKKKSLTFGFKRGG